VRTVIQYDTMLSASNIVSVSSDNTNYSEVVHILTIYIFCYWMASDVTYRYSVDSINRPFRCFIYITGPPLWSSGQSSSLLIQRSGFDFRRYQIFRGVVGLERGPLSLVTTIEDLEEKKLRLRSKKPRLRPQEIRRADYATALFPQKLALT
jgi:hypothetical protein